MKKIITILSISLFAFLGSCNTDDTSEPSSIEIRNYKLNFPTTFTLEEIQGIDSYVGYIKGSGITLTFDYGWYTSAYTGLSPEEYLVTEDEIQGHYRQIVKPVNSENNYTNLHIYKISDTINNEGGYNSLSVYTNNLNSSQQQMIVEVFNTIEIIE